MSKTTKKKHVVREVLDEFVLPTDKQTIVRVVSSRGNNLHEIETSNGERFLTSMPTKFRKNIWIKRGDFVIIEPIEEGGKVKAEIMHILYKEQIKYIKQEGLWPSEFNSAEQTTQSVEREKCYLNNSGSEEDSESDNDIFVNTNRPECNHLYDDSSDDSDESEEDK